MFRPSFLTVAALCSLIGCLDEAPGVAADPEAAVIPAPATLGPAPATGSSTPTGLPAAPSSSPTQTPSSPAPSPPTPMASPLTGFFDGRRQESTYDSNTGSYNYVWNSESLWLGPDGRALRFRGELPLVDAITEKELARVEPQRGTWRRQGARLTVEWPAADPWIATVLSNDAFRFHSPHFVEGLELARPTALPARIAGEWTSSSFTSLDMYGNSVSSKRRLSLTRDGRMSLKGNLFVYHPTAGHAESQEFVGTYSIEGLTLRGRNDKGETIALNIWALAGRVESPPVFLILDDKTYYIDR